MADRGVPVVDFPRPLGTEDQPLQSALDVLRQSVGRVSAIVDIPLLSVTVPANVILDETTSDTGYVLTGATGSGTSITGAATALNTVDAWLDQVRVIVTGKANTATATVQLYDTTNAVVLASLTLATSLGVQAGAWTVITPKGGDRTLQVRVIGDGSHTQTLYSVRAQFRTLRFTP